MVIRFSSTCGNSLFLLDLLRIIMRELPPPFPLPANFYVHLVPLIGGNRSNDFELRGRSRTTRANTEKTLVVLKSNQYMSHNLHTFKLWES